MSNFYTLLTRVGAALHTNAQVNQTTVPWTHMRLGDGNGAPVTPTETQTGLVRQVHTLQITDISVHPDNPNWVIAEAVVPSDVGGWTVREAAVYGGADGNTCIAVGNYPETYKPVLAEGAGREMVMRMVVEISSVATVKLQIDPAVAIASRAWVESLVATPVKAGLMKFATKEETKELFRSDRAVTPAGLGAALDDAGLNERLDMIDVQVAALEGREKPLGHGQSWQNMTALRAVGVTYTNTTGRTIFVATEGNRSTDSDCEVRINGQKIFLADPNAVSGVVNTFFVVPAGATYGIFLNPVGFAMWSELR